MNQLVARRIASGVPPATIAKTAGINQLSYWRYERGDRTPSVVTAIKVADALGVEVSDEFRTLWTSSNPEQTVQNGLA